MIRHFQENALISISAINPGSFLCFLRQANDADVFCLWDSFVLEERLDTPGRSFLAEKRRNVIYWLTPLRNIAQVGV